MKQLLIGIILGLLATSAFASQTNNGCQGNCPTTGGTGTVTATGGNATALSASFAAAQAASVAKGGDGGTATATVGAPVTTVTGSPVNVESKSLSFAGTGLAASANSCQGSLSIGPFGGTYSVEFCKLLAIADGMRASAFNPRSVQKVLCRIEEVKESEECQGLAK